MKPTIRIASTVSLMALLAGPAFAQAADDGTVQNVNEAPTLQMAQLTQDEIRQDGRAAENGAMTGANIAEVLSAIDQAFVAGEPVMVKGADGQAVGTLVQPVIERGNSLSMRIQLDDSLASHATEAEFVTSAALDGNGRIVVPLTRDEVVTAVTAGMDGAMGGVTETQGAMTGGEAGGINLDMPDAARGTM